MKIALIIYGSLETRSGGYLYDRMLVERLRAAGDQVDILSLPWRNYPRHLGDNLSTGLWRKLRGLRVDILLQDELNHPSLFWLNHRAQTRGSSPIVSIVHHLRSSELRPSWHNRFYGAVERRYLQSIDGFIWNSQTTRREVQALASATQPGVVAYPGRDHLVPTLTAAQVAERAGLPGPLRLLFLGNLIPRKGLHVLLEALVTIPARDWRLTVIGDLDLDRSYVQAIRQQVASRFPGSIENLHLAGPLYQDQLVRQLEANQVLVVPSSYEGFGIAYLEGMGFGLPAIATAAGAAGELITPGENGLLTPPEDPASLAEGLWQLISDRALLARLATGALHRYAEHPTWEQSAQQVRTFLSGFL